MTILDLRKQRARQRRERKLRRWMATLSWTTPVMAFGSMFTIWHHVSDSVLIPKPHVSNASNMQTTVLKPTAPTAQPNVVKDVTPKPKALFSVGSRSQQVVVIQERLSALGYFHHAITTYYGSVTSSAVKAFQANHSLPQTGNVDAITLKALEMATKNVVLHHPVATSPTSSRRTNVTTAVHHSSQSGHHTSSSVTRSVSTPASTTVRSSGSATVSQPSSQPVVTTGAS